MLTYLFSLPPLAVVGSTLYMAGLVGIAFGLIVIVDVSGGSRTRGYQRALDGLDRKAVAPSPPARTSIVPIVDAGLGVIKTERTRPGTPTHAVASAECPSCGRPIGRSAYYFYSEADAGTLANRHLTILHAHCFDRAADALVLAAMGRGGDGSDCVGV